MRYPSEENELAKNSIMPWLTDQFDGDEESARKFAKMHLAVMELRERGYGWTDI